MKGVKEVKGVKDGTNGVLTLANYRLSLLNY